MVARLREEKKSSMIGFNAATLKYEDLMAAGIIDPAKVTRSALQNAASIAAMLLTTEACVTDEPEKEDPWWPALLPLLFLLLLL